MVAARAWPAVSILFLTYAQERFVRAALRSVLDQDYPELQIVVSDDCSPDGTHAAALAELEGYRGPHRVLARQNATRQRFCHTGVAIPYLLHDIVVIAHGDDVSAPHRVRRQVEAMLDTGATLVSSDAELIDAEGVSLGLMEGSGRSRPLAVADMIREGWRRTMLGSTFAYRKTMRAAFRPTTQATPPSFDHVLPVRAALMSGAYFIGEPLIRYRRHDDNAGHSVADHTSTEAIFRETTAANGLASLGWLIGDVEDWVRRGAGAAAPPELLAELRRAALARVDRFADRRLRLMAEGLAPQWAPHAEMARRPIAPIAEFTPHRPAEARSP